MRKLAVKAAYVSGTRGKNAAVRATDFPAFRDMRMDPLAAEEVFLMAAVAMVVDVATSAIHRDALVAQFAGETQSRPDSMPYLADRICRCCRQEPFFPACQVAAEFIRIVGINPLLSRCGMAYFETIKSGRACLI